jgi:putative phosphoribosyl transferase
MSRPDDIETEVSIEASKALLQGTLHVPESCSGIVLFAHGSGSSRRSPRNRYVAQVLESRGIATLLFDLLTREEESIDAFTAELRFNIPLLAKRLVEATQWVMRRPDLQDLRIGYFGASTGAAAALVAAAKLPEAVSAIVSRGGRPDLAAEALRKVEAPALLIVGGDDEPVISMNQGALEKLNSPEKELVIIPGATHLFEEPGTLEEVARIAAEWFARYLPMSARISVSAGNERQG